MPSGARSGRNYGRNAFAEQPLDDVQKQKLMPQCLLANEPFVLGPDLFFDRRNSRTTRAIANIDSDYGRHFSSHIRWRHIILINNFIAHQVA